jgi:hypothetical protein
MKAGLVVTAFTLAMASRSVPSASGLAGLLKPIWLSLICRKVKPADSAAKASPSRPKDFGTPPDSVHNTPVPRPDHTFERAPSAYARLISFPPPLVTHHRLLRSLACAPRDKETGVGDDLFPQAALFF